MNKVIESLKWFGAGTGAIVPAWDFFKSEVPPSFPEIGILMVPLAAAIALIMSIYGSGEARNRIALKSSVVRGATCIAISLVLLISYRVFLDNWTVLDPQSFRTRYQIGFGESGWSLTAVGLATKAALGTSTPGKLMLANRGFAPSGPAQIWKQWTIDMAGVVLILLYLVGFILWTSGFALLSKCRALTENRSAPD
jgi:hypothetical protein